MARRSTATPAPPAVVRLRVLYATLGAGIGSLGPYLVLYLRWRGLSATEAGLVLGLMSAVGVVAVPLWGLVADRGGGAARSLGVSCLLAALSSLALLAAGSSLPAIVAAALLLAAARAPGEALADSLTLGVLGSQASHRYGAIRLWSSLGFAVAVAAWGMLVDRTSLALIPLAYAVAMVVELASTVGHDWPSRTMRGLRPAAGIGDVLSPGFRLLLAGAGIFGVAMSASFTVAPLRLTDVGGGVTAVAAAAVIGALTEIPLMRSSGRIRERLGARLVFLVGGALFALSLVVYGVLAEPALLVGASILRGAGYALVYVALVTASAGLLPPDRQATGQALLQTTLMGVAPILGASVGGFLYGHGSAAVLFLAAAAVALAGTATAAKAGAEQRLDRA